MFRPLSATALVLAALPAHAEPPRVVADVAPVHSLVAQVMEGIGSPSLLVEPGGDVHHLAMRPSVASALEGATLIVHVGTELTPWLEAPLARLGEDATVLTLMDAPGWTPREFDSAEEMAPTEVSATDEAGQDAHDHGDDHGHDDHAHEDHDDHAAEAGHEDHADGHAHEGVDPHAWLDPQAAAAWVEAIRAALAEADPENAETYARNAAATTERLAGIEEEISRRLLALPQGGWIAPHDAYGYFEDRFAFPAAGVVTDAEDAAPGPAHLAELRAMVAGGEVTCVLAAPGGDTGAAQMLVRGSDARTGTLDATGAGLEPGPQLYAALMTGIADSLETCLAP